MGQLGIDHDEKITKKLFADVPPDCTLKIATGYFNLTNQYMETLIDDSKGQCDILMAHPKVSKAEQKKLLQLICILLVLTL